MFRVRGRWRSANCVSFRQGFSASQTRPAYAGTATQRFTAQTSWSPDTREPSSAARATLPRRGRPPEPDSLTPPPSATAAPPRPRKNQTRPNPAMTRNQTPRTTRSPARKTARTRWCRGPPHRLRRRAPPAASARPSAGAKTRTTKVLLFPYVNRKRQHPRWNDNARTTTTTKTAYPAVIRRFALFNFCFRRVIIIAYFYLLIKLFPLVYCVKAAVWKGCASQRRWRVTEDDRWRRFQFSTTRYDDVWCWGK